MILTKGYSMRLLLCLNLIFVIFSKPLEGGLLRYQVSIENRHLINYHHRNVNCPQKRPSPDLRILHDTLEFDKACWQEDLTSDTCSKSERFCHQDIILMKDVGREDFSLSILVKYKCLKSGVKRLLRWNQLIIDIHCHLNMHSIMKIKNMQDEIQRVLGSSDHHTYILFMKTKGSIYLRINGEAGSTKSTGTDKGGLPERQTMIFGVDMRAERSENIQTFTGAILMADLFLRGLTLEEQDQEYQYIQLLLKNTPHPWCVCPQSNLNYTDSALTCPDRRSRLTGGVDQDQFFTPPASLHDGIKDSSLKYGFWPANLGDEVDIILEAPSNLNRVEIYAVGFPTTVKMFLKCNIWRELFCASNGAKHHCQHGSLKWNAVEGERFQKLTWEPSATILAENIKLKVEEIDQGQDLSEILLPFEGAIPIYEIILHGRSLNYQNADGSCFPMNSDGSGLDDCGRCNCRAGERAYTGRTCKPYITNMVPQYGPVAGGTVITFTGGLLAPDHSIACTNTSVKFNQTDICTAYFRNDTHIVCTTRALPDELSHVVNNTHFITISLLINNVFYPVQTVQHFEYRPNPIIEQIHPKFSFRGGNHGITIRGKHLDSVDVLHKKEIMTVTLVHKELVAPCYLRTSSELVCSMPAVDALRALVSFKFDGYLKYTNMTAAFPDWSSLTIYPDPKVYHLGSLHFSKGDYLKLKGANLDACCKVEDYSVMVGGEIWAVLEVKSTYLTCSPPQMSQTKSGALDIVVKVYNYTFNVGYLQYTENSMPLVIVVSISVGLVILILILFIGTLMIVRRKLTRLPSPNLVNTEEHGHVEPGPSIELLQPRHQTILDLLEGDFHRVISEHLIDKSKLQILEEVGKGQFGRVHRGILEVNHGTTEVALKTLKDPHKLSSDEVTDFLEEATIMRDFDHTNILPLLGVMIDDLSCYVVLPFMENGDLKTYVSHEDLNLEMNTNLTLDVANGMEYLEQQKFVHRDLAARNCMVNASKVAVIGDFGLARDIYGKEYYKSENTRPLPYKWMALECIEDRMYSSYSDVWAFGVLMWEIFMKGATPYPLVPNKRLKKFLKRGNRLDKPRICPREIYALMIECWSENPNDRPTFATVLSRLQQLMRTFRERGFTIEEDSSVTSSSTDSTSSTHVVALPSLEDCTSPSLSIEDYLTPAAQKSDDASDQKLPGVTRAKEASQHVVEIQPKEDMPQLQPAPSTSSGVPQAKPRPQERKSILQKRQNLGDRPESSPAAAKKLTIQDEAKSERKVVPAERLDTEGYLRPVPSSVENVPGKTKRNRRIRSAERPNVQVDEGYLRPVACSVKGVQHETQRERRMRSAERPALDGDEGYLRPVACSEKHT